MNGNGEFTIERGPFKAVIIGQWVDDAISKGEIKYYKKSSN